MKLREIKEAIKEFRRQVDDIEKKLLCAVEEVKEPQTLDQKISYYIPSYENGNEGLRFDRTNGWTQAKEIAEIARSHFKGCVRKNIVLDKLKGSMKRFIRTVPMDLIEAVIYDIEQLKEVD